MHYIGMAALRLPAICQFNSLLVVLSVVFAVLISLAALWITFHFRDEKTGIGWEKLAGAVVMGAAIPVMHYTGMAAASFTPSGMPADLSHAVSISTLGTAGIAAVTFIVLGLALLTSWVDRRFAAQTVELQEAKLQRSEAYLAEAQRLSHTGSFGWRPSTSEILWSDETFRIFQYDRTTIPTVELILQRVHPEDTALMKQIIERASQEGKDFDYECRLAMPEGSVKYVHVVAHALSMTMGELAASIAHEVNQPLAGIVINGNACLRWLAGESPNLAEAREAAQRIIRDGTRASDIISRIRALARKTGTLTERVDLNEAIREVLALGQGEARKHDVGLRTRLPSDLPPVRGDRVLIQQVVLNLVMNGIEAMSDAQDHPRELVIQAQSEAQQVRVTVQDSGTGLDPQTQERIFEALYTTKPGGLGMGLSISRTIVENHGGRLSVVAQGGPGATFEFTLPAYP
jgi:signal transduction histidine kinase